MKKSKQVFTIIFVVVFFVSVGIFTFFNGVKPHDVHYVRIEVNPKIEFLTNMQNKVKSVMPLNKQAKELLADEEFIGLSIEDATKKFIDLCTQANYIDCNAKDNAIRISVVSGFMQVLEMNIYESINSYLMENEIYAVIVENDNDLNQTKIAKQKGVSSANKLAIINSILQLDESQKFEDLKSKKEAKLLNILQNIHNSICYSTKEYSIEELSNKAKLIDFNRVNLEKHKKQITNESLKNFQKKFDEYKRETLKDYEIDFDKSYNNWSKNLV